MNDENVVDFLPSGEKSDQELITEGAELISRQSRNARELGEWFNSVKRGRAGKLLVDRQAVSAAKIIEKANNERGEGTDPISIATATHYGMVVEAFPTVASQKGLSFSACKTLLPVRNSRSIEDFNRWHYEVSIGNCPETDPDSDYKYSETNPKPLIGRDLARQIAIATNKLTHTTSDKVEEVTSTTAALEHIAPVIESIGLSRPKAKKITTAVAKEFKKIETDIRGHFIDEVNAAADKIADQRTEEVRAAAETQRKASRAAREKYERQSKVTKAMQDRLPMFITKEEYRFIRGVLKSDRVADELKPRFDKAYAIFERLAEGGDWS